MPIQQSRKRVFCVYRQVSFNLGTTRLWDGNGPKKLKITSSRRERRHVKDGCLSQSLSLSGPKRAIQEHLMPRAQLLT